MGKHTLIDSVHIYGNKRYESSISAGLLTTIGHDLFNTKYIRVGQLIKELYPNDIVYINGKNIWELDTPLEPNVLLHIEKIEEEYVEYKGTVTTYHCTTLII